MQGAEAEVGGSAAPHADRQTEPLRARSDENWLDGRRRPTWELATVAEANADSRGQKESYHVGDDRNTHKNGGHVLREGVEDVECRAL